MVLAVRAGVPAPSAELSEEAAALELGERRELLLGMRLSSMRRWVAAMEVYAGRQDVRRNKHAGALAGTRIEAIRSGCGTPGRAGSVREEPGGL